MSLNSKPVGRCQQARRFSTARFTLNRYHERRCFRQGYTWIAGVDEVGVGALAGPVVAVAVVMPLESGFISGIRDSKRLSPVQREDLTQRILHHAITWSVGWCSPCTIDRLGIYRARLQAMAQAVAGLVPAPNMIWVDGNAPLPTTLPQHCWVGGDNRIYSIACASIVAKTLRDRWMVDLDALYPQYGFGVHKGYPTPRHLDALAAWGPLKIHRYSYAPVASSVKPFVKKQTILAEMVDPS